MIHDDCKTFVSHEMKMSSENLVLSFLSLTNKIWHRKKKMINFWKRFKKQERLRLRWPDDSEKQSTQHQGQITSFFPASNHLSLRIEGLQLNTFNANSVQTLLKNDVKPSPKSSVICFSPHWQKQNKKNFHEYSKNRSSKAENKGKHQNN